MLETPHPFASAVEMCRLLRSGRLTPLELMRETLGRIERLNASLNAFVCLRAEEALAEAELATQALSRGEDPGPLAGLPLAVKDRSATPSNSWAEPRSWPRAERSRVVRRRPA